ncbi:hypothetical protein, partial [Bacillus hominis]|uniref:hypothetical protein n=1 Tax=Bacillus hominis TaxID=2817478 RepID=UPI001BB2F6D0
MSNEKKELSLTYLNGITGTTKLTDSINKNQGLLNGITGTTKLMDSINKNQGLLNGITGTT